MSKAWVGRKTSQMTQKTIRQEAGPRSEVGAFFTDARSCRLRMTRALPDLERPSEARHGSPDIAGAVAFLPESGRAHRGLKQPRAD